MRKAPALLGQSVFPLAFALLFALALVPIWATELPPLVDYPNHLARMHVLLTESHAPLLALYYQVNWGFLPNLAMDGVVYALGQVLPVTVASKVFLSLVLGLLASGTAALHRAIHGRKSLWPLVAFLLLYNRYFLWGFVNYLAGVGLGLWLLALWIGTERRRGWIRAIGFIPGAYLVYLAHLQAFFIYALVLLAYEGGRAISAYRAKEKGAWGGPVQAAIQVLAVLVPFVALSPTVRGYSGLSYRGLLSKLYPLVSMLNNYHPIADGLCEVLFLGLIIWGFVKAKLWMDRRFWLPLGALLAAFLAMPFEMMSSFSADHRMMVAIALLWVAATDLKGISRRAGLALAGLLVLVYVGRTGALYLQWQKSNRLYAKVQKALDKIEPGSRLATAISYPKGYQPWPTPLIHLASVAVVHKDAFVPTLFADPTQQPISLRPGCFALGHDTHGPLFEYQKTPVWDFWLGHYDYVLLFNEKGFAKAPPRAELIEIEASDEFALYRTPSAGKWRQGAMDGGPLGCDWATGKAE